jgi:hypothetical protein
MTDILRFTNSQRVCFLPGALVAAFVEADKTCIGFLGLNQKIVDNREKPPP